MLDQLASTVQDKTANVAVIGLGYVGLPVACMLARAGFNTLGVDIAADRVAKINAGQNPIEGKEPGLSELLASVTGSGKLRCTTDYADLSDTDVILISVQTPIEDDTLRPKYRHLRSALENLGKVMKKGALVILESTLAPGTIQGIVIPTLEEVSGGKAGETFWVGHCPERVMPGRLLQNLTEMSRVVGGLTDETADVMIQLYRNYVQGEMDKTDILTAELVKTTENAYRDMQIAFVNEMAMVCEVLGGDVWRLRELVNKSPGRNLLYPGAGVGGHCIPKDGWLLIANVRDHYESAMIPASRKINRAMPDHMVDLTEKALAECGKDMSDATIAVLGYSYLANSDDTRDTPSQAYIETAAQRGADIRIHDFYVDEYNQDLDSVLQGADAAVIMVAHDEYFDQDWQENLKKMRTPVLIDGRHVLPDDFAANGAQVRVLGRGQLN